MEGQALSREAGEIVREFVVRKMALLLPEPDCVAKVREDKQMLDKLGICLTARDIQPLITAMVKFVDDEQSGRCIKGRLNLQDCFVVLSSLCGDSAEWAYYTRFSGIKLGKPNISDTDYVLLALKILDCRNWDGNLPNAQTKGEIKSFCFASMQNPNLDAGDKIHNLNLLQKELNIALDEREKGELSQRLKDNIMGLVELIDQMRTTSFGAVPPPVNPAPRIESGYETAKLAPAPVPVSGPEPAHPADEQEGRKKKFGLFGKK